MPAQLLPNYPNSPTSPTFTISFFFSMFLSLSPVGLPIYSRVWVIYWTVFDGSQGPRLWRTLTLPPLKPTAPQLRAGTCEDSPFHKILTFKNIISYRECTHLLYRSSVWSAQGNSFSGIHSAVQPGLSPQFHRHQCLASIPYPFLFQLRSW